MAQSSVTYAVARTRVLEARLITGERLRRMLDAPDFESVKRALSEAGYGDAEADDYELMIAREMDNACQYVREVTPNELATGVFLLKNDCYNLKCLLKARLMEMDAGKLLSESGTLPSDVAVSAIHERNFYLMPPHMAAVCEQLEQGIEAGTVDAQQVDLDLDRACFADMEEYALQSKDQLVLQSVRAQADLLNLRTFMRLRAGGQKADALQNALVPGGNIAERVFIESFNVADDGIYRQLGLGQYADAAGPGLEEYFKSGSLSTLERLSDDYITNLFRKHRHESFTVAPLIGYLIAKERETQAVRLLMVAKANALPLEMVTERLRELYEQ